MCDFFAWNPINLLDVEAKWFMKELLVLFGAVVLSKCIGYVLRVIDRRVKSSLFYVFAESIYIPSLFLLWFFVALFSFELVTDDFFKEQYPRFFSGLVNSAVVLTVGWFLFRFKNGLIAHIAKTKKQKGESLDVATLLVISKLFSIGIVIFVVLLLYDAMGMSLTTFLAFGGVGGLALAFASQEIFSNFFGGFMIHLTRPFTLKEAIRLPAHNIDGIIEEIGWYQTCLRSPSKDIVYIPNSLFSKALLVNKSRITRRTVDDQFSFSIYPLSEITAILQEITEYLRSHSKIDANEWARARISSFNGPICTIVFHAIFTTVSFDEYCMHRDEILLHIGDIIFSHGGVLSGGTHMIF